MVHHTNCILAVEQNRQYEYWENRYKNKPPNSRRWTGCYTG